MQICPVHQEAFGSGDSLLLCWNSINPSNGEKQFTPFPCIHFGECFFACEAGFCESHDRFLRPNCSPSIFPPRQRSNPRPRSGEIWGIFGQGFRNIVHPAFCSRPVASKDLPSSPFLWSFTHLLISSSLIGQSRQAPEWAKIMRCFPRALFRRAQTPEKTVGAYTSFQSERQSTHLYLENISHHRAHRCRGNCRRSAILRR